LIAPLYRSGTRPKTETAAKASITSNENVA